MFRDTSAGAVVTVRVTPRAGRSGISGIRDDQLLVRLTAAPVDNAANDALIDVLSDALDVPRRDIRIVSGERSRTKHVVVTGRRAADLNEALGPPRADR
jgi:uncharacterized protein (TIGR00251 family)